jgi:hypothetical protein
MEFSFTQAEEAEEVVWDEGTPMDITSTIKQTKELPTDDETRFKMTVNTYSTSTNEVLPCRHNKENSCSLVQGETAVLQNSSSVSSKWKGPIGTPVHLHSSQ